MLKILDIQKLKWIGEYLTAQAKFQNQKTYPEAFVDSVYTDFDLWHFYQVCTLCPTYNCFNIKCAYLQRKNTGQTHNGLTTKCSYLQRNDATKKMSVVICRKTYKADMMILIECVICRESNTTKAHVTFKF